MKLIKDTKKAAKLQGSILTLGNFDGLHLGHQKILNKITSRARARALPSVVYTFDPHPQKVLTPEKSPLLITTTKDKASLIEDMRVDVLIMARFTKDFASTHPKTFVKDILIEKLGVKEIWVGHDYFFGKGKQGSVGYLKELGDKLGFFVGIIDAHKKDGDIVSSSRIRALIKEGQVGKAGRLLGRSYSISGRVIKGRDVGSTLGFPTANLSTKAELIPGGGVYAGYVTVDDKTLPTVINIGTAPTFKRGKTIVECHILDFKGSIYGKNIRVFFKRRLRGERLFKDIESLTEQISKDVLRARAIL
jgi:riboflavin kinase/FMN adenylyltransferase